MKRKIAALLACTMLATSVLLPSCGEDTQQEQPGAANAVIVKDGQSEYTIVRSKDVARGDALMSAAADLKKALTDVAGTDVKSGTDSATQAEKEILIGATSREETARALESIETYQYIIKVDGNKVIIASKSDAITVQALEYFIATYVPEGSTSVELPADLNYVGSADFSTSTVHNLNYEEMGDTIIRAFDSYHREANGNLKDTEFWDAAEILEAYLDAYEQTGKAEYLEWAESIAKAKFGAANNRVDWCRNNQYNDDIAWACIAFTRLYQFTGTSKYLTIAKTNFDTMWERAYSPDVLGGGLWWKNDEKNTKNSCIQCPASIAACLIGKMLNDDSYFEKAKELMEWEFETLFVPETGQVYDAKRTSGEYNYWASTYNQGTFVGACMMLHEKYGDQKYLDYASKAVEFGMNSLDNKDGVFNGETGGLDVIGFKGILTRWFYRYAQYTENLDILAWLQLNADTAYGNRNEDNWIWTNWAEKTNVGGIWSDKDAENGRYDIWGLSAAVALLFNCEPWW